MSSVIILFGRLIQLNVMQLGGFFKIRRDINCNTDHGIYMAYCKLCDFQGVGSTASWKPMSMNYKSHINKNVSTTILFSIS